jgi:hypothetical protein
MGLSDTAVLVLGRSYISCWADIMFSTVLSNSKPDSL